VLLFQVAPKLLSDDEEQIITVPIDLCLSYKGVPVRV
jgi:hypothetical protein